MQSDPICVNALKPTRYHIVWCVLQASVASIPFIGKITIALQFLFVQRRGSADKNNRYTQAAGQTVEKLTERAADDRCGNALDLSLTPHALAAAGRMQPRVA